ncbi:MAG: hypothetical protein KIT87_15930, partial [Anaerolineae bacterium]|nr:hypothetical protein [Anaerolineae bacterium]
MKTRSLLAALSVLMLLFAFGSSVRADGPPPQPASPEGQDSVTTLVNDRTITIRSQADIEAKRLALRQFIWGTDTLPTQLPTTVTRNVASPVRGLTNLARVDDLHITMEDSVQGLAHHFIPQRPNNRLVIVHGGHDCTFDAAPSYADTDIGLQRTISQLLIDGY